MSHGCREFQVRRKRWDQSGLLCLMYPSMRCGRMTFTGFLGEFASAAMLILVMWRGWFCLPHLVNFREAMCAITHYLTDWHAMWFQADIRQKLWSIIPLQRRKHCRPFHSQAFKAFCSLLRLSKTPRTCIARNSTHSLCWSCKGTPSFQETTD